MVQGKIVIERSVPPATAHTSRPLSNNAVEPRTEASRSSNSNCFASRDWSVAALTVWNSLPENIVNSDTSATIIKRLKTHLFHSVRWNVHATKRLCISYYGAIHDVLLYYIVLYCIVLYIIGSTYDSS